ncbi:DUF4573 domain-containing protein [Streptomyces sp. NBC_00984]|uniref:DUF4573 domain-containing protein n=1 Tax=Streptomyces sp. NBC_00984 TaxID=2903700 RepID=UPI0038660272
MSPHRETDEGSWAMGDLGRRSTIGRGSPTGGSRLRRPGLTACRKRESQGRRHHWLLAGSGSIRATTGTRNIRPATSTRNIRPATSTRNIRPATSTRNIRATTSTRNIRPATSTRNIRPATSTRNIRPATSTRNIRATTGTRNIRPATSTRNIRATTGTRNIRPATSTRNIRATTDRVAAADRVTTPGDDGATDGGTNDLVQVVDCLIADLVYHRLRQTKASPRGLRRRYTLCRRFLRGGTPASRRLCRARSGSRSSGCTCSGRCR